MIGYVAQCAYCAAGKPLTWILWSLASSWRRLHAQQRRGHIEQHQFYFFGRKPRRIARDVRGAAGNRAGIHGRCVGIGGNHVHVVGGNAQFLRRDLRQNRQRALARLHGARQQRRGAVFIHLHHGRARIGGYREADRIPHAWPCRVRAVS